MPLHLTVNAVAGAGLKMTGHRRSTAEPWRAAQSSSEARRGRVKRCGRRWHSGRVDALVPACAPAGKCRSLPLPCAPCRTLPYTPTTRLSSTLPHPPTLPPRATARTSPTLRHPPTTPRATTTSLTRSAHPESRQCPVAQDIRSLVQHHLRECGVLQSTAELTQANQPVARNHPVGNSHLGMGCGGRHIRHRPGTA